MELKPTIAQLLVESLRFGGHQSANFQPVTALWLVSIPLVNAVFVMKNRSMSGTSLMEAKSDHVHDILLKRKLSFESVYAILILSSGFLAKNPELRIKMA